MFTSKISITIVLTAVCLICVPIHRALAQATQPAAPAHSIVDFGALGDGTTMNTAAIQKAIDQIAADGGGTLVIPEGVFLSGAIFLKPGVNLHLDRGAVLKGSTDVNDYPMRRTRVEGHFQDWLPALVNASESDNLRIDGEGTLDGSGTPFYAAYRSARKQSKATKNLDVPRPRLIYIEKSNNVTIAGIHLLNSGFWNVHLYHSQHVTVDGLTIDAAAGSPSTDGVDIDSCQWVEVKNTTISNNDDCICLKGSKGVNASQNKDSPPVEHIRVSNCTIEMGASILTCGSEATIVRDVTIDHCKVVGPHTHAVAALRLKLRTDTPQLYEDIHLSDITLDSQGVVITVAPWSQYEDLKGQPKPVHTVRDISISNVTGTCRSFGSIRPNPGDTIENITLENIDLTLTASDGMPNFNGVRGLVVKNVKLNGADYVPPAELTQPATAPAAAPSGTLGGG